MKKPRPAKSSSGSNSRTAKTPPNQTDSPASPADFWPRAQNRQHAKAYRGYLGIASYLYRFAADMANHEGTMLDNQFCEVGLSGVEIKNPDYVPNLSQRLPREMLEDIIRMTQYLIDKGEQFKRYHEGRCRKCGEKLPNGKRLFCKRTCSNNWHSDRHRDRQAGNKIADKYQLPFIVDQMRDANFSQKERNQRPSAIPEELSKESCKVQDKSLANSKKKISQKP